MQIPEYIVQQIRERADILDVVSEHVSLKKKGRYYFGLCPFHEEKTPSFSVDPDRQIFHCFGCGAGGNAISFVMQIQKVSFLEAVRELARKLNIPLPEDNPNDPEARRRLQAYEANEFAAEFFHTNLLQTPAGEKARAYLRKRGFDRRVIEKFKLGWALDSWDGLIREAKLKKISLEGLRTAGLVSRSEQGREYDRFRGRLMFPIFTASGQVAGFGGRLIEDDPKQAKYINTQESPVYHKSSILYGLRENRGAIQQADQAILVEGYADVISLVQFGIENVVASSGTSLTERQAQLLLRYTKNVVILYDGDPAGAHAALRGVDILLDKGLRISVVMLPKEHDPDSFVRQEGPEKLRRLIDQAQDIIEFKISAYRSVKPDDSPQNRAELLHLLVETVARISDEVLRNLYAQQIAGKMGLPDETVFKEIGKVQRNQRLKKKPGTESASVNTAAKAPGARFTAERDLVHIVLNYPDFQPLVFQNLDLNEVNEPDFRAILGRAFQKYRQGEEVTFQEALDVVESPAIQALLAELGFQREENLGEEELRTWVEDCLATIKLTDIRRQIQLLRQEMRQAQHSGSGNLDELNRKYLALKQEELRIRERDWAQKATGEKEDRPDSFPDDVPF